VLAIAEELVGAISLAAHKALHLAGERQKLGLFPLGNLERHH
jgi:hypothetical protein